MRRKLIAIVMTVVLVAGMAWTGGGFSNQAEASEVASISNDYEPVSLESYGFGPNTTIKSDTLIKTLSTEKTLGGTVIAGKYQFSPTLNIICFGGIMEGFRIQSISEDEWNVMFWTMDGETETPISDVQGKWNVTSAEANMKLAGRELDMSLAFDVESLTETTARLKVTMVLDGTFTKVFEYESVPKDTIKQIIVARSYTDDVPLVVNKKPIYNYTELYMSDFGVDTIQECVSEGQTAFRTTTPTASLDEFAINGTFNFKKGAVLFIGESWAGIKMYCESDGSRLTAVNIATTQHEEMNWHPIKASDLGRTSLSEQDLDIRMTFKFTNTRVLDDVECTDLLFEITVDQFTTSTIYEGIQTAYLKQAMWGTDVTLRNPKYYEETTLGEYGFAENTTIKNDVVYKTLSEEATLDGTVITGKYQFSPTLNIVCYGAIMEGLRIQSTSEDELNVMFWTEGGNTPVSDVQGKWNITSAEANMKLAGRELDMSLAFDVMNATSTTADMKVKITLDNTFSKEFVFENVPVASMKQFIMAKSYSDDVPLIMNKAKVYTEHTLGDYGVENAAKLTAVDKSWEKDAQSSLDGTKIVGRYYFSPANNVIHFGGEGLGFTIQALNENEMDVAFITNGSSNPKRDESGFSNITVEESGMSLADRVIKMELKFDVKTVTQTQGNLKVQVILDDTFSKIFEYHNVPLDEMKQVISASSLDSDSPMFLNLEEGQDIPSEYETYTLSDYGFGEYTELINQNVMKTLSDEKTLDGTSITGNYHFSDFRSLLCFGGKWTGLRIQTIGIWGLEVVFNTNSGEIIYDQNGNVTISPEEAGMPLSGANIKIKLDFDVEYVTEETGNLKVRITLEDRYIKNFKFNNIPLKDIKQVIFAQSTEDYPMWLNLGEEEFVKPDLTPITMQEAGIDNKDYEYQSSANGGKVAHGQHTASLINTVVTQRVLFSNHKNLIVKYAGLQNETQGIQFATQADGSIKISAANGEFAETYVLSSDIAGRALLGKEMKLSLELFENGEDMMLGVNIDGVRYNNQYFKLTGTKGKLGNYVGLYIGEKGGNISFRTSPTVNADFKQLTFDSYLIYSDTYGYVENGGLAVEGNCKLDSLDRVVISDTLNFTDEAGAQLFIGGKEHGWSGLLLSSLTNGSLALNDVVDAVAAEKNPMFIFDSETAGVGLTDNDVEMTFSFEYVDADGDGSKDDLKLGVWFNGKSYNDEWIYLYDIAPYLGGRISVYSPNPESSLTIKTFNPPIDFAEWGFTKDWAKTLGLV